MPIKFYILPLLFIGCTLHAQDEPDSDTDQSTGQTLLEQQKEKLKLIQADMNQSGKDLYDTLTNNPQKVVESGCLDNVRGVGVDGIVIDPANMLGAIYSAIKDEIMNQACSAATDYANQMNEELEYKLELPLGISSLEVGAGESATGEGGIFQPNVELDNEKVANEVTQSVLEDARNSSYSTSSGLQKNATQQQINKQLRKDTSDVESKIENAIDIDKLWGAEGEEGEEGNNEGGQ